MMRIKDFCSYDSKSSIKAGEALTVGKYAFFTSSADETKRINGFQYDGERIIMGTGGNATLHYFNGKFAVSTDCVVLKPESIVLCKYLYYFFLANMRILEDGFKGAGLRHTNKNYIDNITIKTIPTIANQKNIVFILDKINTILKLRKKELQKADDLIKARFVEMFGNPVVGDRIKGNKHKIGDFASVTKLAGFEFTKYIKYKDSGDIIMLRGLNCKKGHLVLDDIKWIDQKTSDLLPRSKLYYGDILMTYAGTIGDVAMVDADNKYHLAPNVGKITIEDKENFNPIYLIHLFMYTHDYIMSFASQVAQASINMEKIRNFEYYFPNIEAQNRFEVFVKQVDKSKVAVQKSLEQTQILFDSLMQQYFG